MSGTWIATNKKELIENWMNTGEPFFYSLVDDRAIVDFSISILREGGTIDPGVQIPGTFGVENNEGGPHYYLFACPECNRFAHKYWYKLTWVEGYWNRREFEPTYYCDFCNGILQKADYEYYQSPKTKQRYTRFYFHDDKEFIIRCPLCGDERFEFL
jgi:hypothetical protein